MSAVTSDRVAAPETSERSELPSLASRWHGWDVVVFGFFLFVGVGVVFRLWVDPVSRVAPRYEADPAQVQWFLAHAVRVLVHGVDPFFSLRMNVPDGVNLMANTQVLGLGVLVAPVTWLWGPAVSFVLLVTVGLAGTAAAWFWVLSHGFGLSRLASVVGGGFCGFAPAMVSHASWHPNIVSQFVVPFIVWRVVVLARGGRWLRDGVVLGLLVTYQAFINEEVLLFTAWAVGVFVVVYGVQRWGVVRPLVGRFVGGLGVTFVVVGVLLAYPLWVQFFGPQHYNGLHPANQDFTVDVAAYAGIASQSLAGSGSTLGKPLLAPGYAEQNAFFGWGILLLLGVTTLWFWRNLVVRSLALITTFFAVLSLGGQLVYHGKVRDVPGPWRLFRDLPLLDSVVPTRFGLVVTALVGVLLAVLVQQVITIGGVIRRTWLVALGLALLPILPTPVPAVHRSPVPEFITAGAWRPYVPEGQTLVPVPVPSPERSHGLRWAAAVNLDFAIPGGYFLAPANADSDQVGIQGAPKAATALLLEQVATSGTVPMITDVEVRRAADDLRRWRAAILVLPVGETNAPALRATVDKLVGPGTRKNDVWMWDVRPITNGNGQL